MTRVKMNAKHEYEYIANFKVLQNAFKTKKIDKVRRDVTFALPNTSDTYCAAYTCGKAGKMQDAVRVFASAIAMTKIILLTSCAQGQFGVHAMDEALLGLQLWRTRL